VPGWPDITLCLPEGRVLFLELKTGKGRMSEDQKQIARSMLFFKHEWHVVRSFKRFLEIVCG
jgi:predicted Holliday junction resolvase-like endonuclease